jgi:hypothetical protein
MIDWNKGMEYWNDGMLEEWKDGRVKEWNARSRIANEKVAVMAPDGHGHGQKRMVRPLGIR